MPLRQLLGRKGRPEIVPVRLTISIARALVSSPIRRFDGRPRNPWTTASSPFTLISREQRSHPPLRDPHLLRGELLRHCPILRSLQPIQSKFLLAHRNPFHFQPSAVYRNFLLCPFRNFSFCRDTVHRSGSGADPHKR
jgi:hypothetical protein